MSGIAGIYYRDDRQVVADDLSRMVNVLAHRGPDGSGVWSGGPIGLAHRMLWTTPESLQEELPLEADGLVITADARLDNRDELIHRLNLGDRLPFEINHGSAMSDSALILAAYQQWGTDCAQRLVGDFAFAIWDANRRRLFCARDAFGVKPFYYYLGDRLFLFASEIKAILSHADAPKCIDEEQVARHFFPVLIMIDKQGTIYQEILRLPPAHSILVTSQAAATSKYWSLDPEREIRLSSDEEYAEAFRELFVEAVSCRLRSAYPVGSTLSGGLDSSSIACAARDIFLRGGKEPLHTFSFLFKDVPQADESQYIQAVVDQGGVRPHSVYPDTYSPFIDLDRVLWHLDAPFYGPNYFMPWEVYRCAREHGVRVLLDGTDGDTTVSHGMDLLASYARSQQWSRFADEARAVVQRFGHPRYASQRGVLYAQGVPYLTRLIRKGKLLAFARGVNELGRQFGVSRKKLAVYSGLRPYIPEKIFWILSRRLRRKDEQAIALAAIAPQFARRVRLEDKIVRLLGEANALPEHDRSIHLRSLNSGALPYSLEWLNGMASAHSIELRFPFCDRRLVEFCLALPAAQKLRQGWSRFVMRKAMQGILPEAVQWRGGKISLAQVNPHGMRAFAQGFVQEVLDRPADSVQNYVNIQAIREFYQQFLQHGEEAGLDWIWATVVFSRWAHQAGIGAG